MIDELGIRIEEGDDGSAVWLTSLHDGAITLTLTFVEPDGTHTEREYLRMFDGLESSPPRPPLPLLPGELPPVPTYDDVVERLPWGTIAIGWGILISIVAVWIDTYPPPTSVRILAAFGMASFLWGMTAGVRAARDWAATWWDR